MTIPPAVYDVCMAALLIFSTVFGAWKGMAWQVASLASLTVSAAVAINFGDSLAPYLSEEAPWNRFLAMLVLYVVTALGIWLLFRLVADLIDRLRLREFDRQIGALFGAAKGVLFCLVITFFAVTLSEGLRQTVLHSRSGYWMAWTLERAAPVLPGDLRAVVGEYIEELDRKLDPLRPADQPRAAQPAAE